MKCSKCGSTTNLSKGAIFQGENVIIGKDDYICDRCLCDEIMMKKIAPIIRGGKGGENKKLDFKPKLL